MAGPNLDDVEKAVKRNNPKQVMEYFGIRNKVFRDYNIVPNIQWLKVFMEKYTRNVNSIIHLAENKPSLSQEEIQQILGIIHELRTDASQINDVIHKLEKACKSLE